MDVRMDEWWMDVDMDVYRSVIRQKCILHCTIQGC